MFNKYMLLKGAVSQHFILRHFLFHELNPPSLRLTWSKSVVNSFIFDKIFVKQRFAPTNAVLSPNKSGENYMRSEKSVKIWSTARVESFVFFSFAKNETVRNRSLFRRVSHTPSPHTLTRTTHTQHTQHTHSPHTLTKQTHNTHSPHTLSTLTHHTQSPHTFTTHSHNTLTTHTNHTRKHT